MNTADFFLKIAGDREMAQEVVESTFGGTLEGFLAALDQADAKAAEGPSDENH